MVTYQQYAINDSNNTFDGEAICELFRQTFSDSEGEAEGNAIASLVNDFMRQMNDGQAANSQNADSDIMLFIASDSGVLCGAVIFSVIRNAENIPTMILSPMATATAWQGKGVGKGLIGYALDVLKAQGVQVVVTYGDINFYGKAGFAQISETLIAAPLKLSYPEGWLAQSLTDAPLPTLTETGCVKALDVPELW